jgi:hypothetical protein
MNVWLEGSGMGRWKKGDPRHIRWKVDVLQPFDVRHWYSVDWRPFRLEPG